MTIEKNKIIAEFLDYDTIVNDSQYPNKPLYVWDLEDYKFHSDWNWLMEVVEKIESFNPNLQSFSINGNRVEIIDFSVKQNLFSYYNDTELTKIQAVYNACLEFIKWNNEQKK